jgi:hypothetical protein
LAISATRAASFWEGGEDGLRVMLGWEVEKVAASDEP